MAFGLIVLVVLLNHGCFKAAKVLMSLSSIELGASPATIGVLYAMYSLFPALLSVYAGRLSDRHGFRNLAGMAAAGLCVGLLLPYFFGGLGMLFASAAIAGACYIFYVVAIQHLFGSIGGGTDRTRNYGIFAICASVTSLVGPVIAGFSIDGIGHRATWLLIAAMPAVSALALWMFSSVLPVHRAPARGAGRQPAFGLLGNAPLRRVLLATAFLEAGMELISFLMPIYGHSIGLTASQIGIVMGAFALAMMLVRIVMPRLARRWGEERVFSASLFVAGAVALMIPAVSGFAALMAVAFVLGLGFGSGAPLSMALSYNRAPAGRSAEAIGLRQTVNKGIETTVPALFGFLSAFLGLAPVYWLGAFLLGCGGWLMASDARGKAVNRDS
jgi:MFS family permease